MCRNLALNWLLLSSLWLSVTPVETQVAANVPDDGAIVLKESQLPKDSRLVGLEMHTVGGVVVAAPKVPPGWTVTLDSDLSWESRLAIHAKAGAKSASLSLLLNPNILMLRRGGPEAKLIVDGWFVLMTEQGAERRIPFSSESFEFVERYARRRISP